MHGISLQGTVVATVRPLVGSPEPKSLSSTTSRESHEQHATYNTTNVSTTQGQPYRGRDENKLKYNTILFDASTLLASRLNPSDH
jgi:hypothetical protein